MEDRLISEHRGHRPAAEQVTLELKIFFNDQQRISLSILAFYLFRNAH
jgi:hypothetical protein